MRPLVKSAGLTSYHPCIQMFCEWSQISFDIFSKISYFRLCLPRNREAMTVEQQAL